MASSDSEDFESADEDVLDDARTELDKKSGPEHMLPLHSNIKEVGLGPGTNETGAGDVLPLSVKNESVAIPGEEVSKPRPSPKLTGKKDAETEVPAVPVSRKERQQKHREQKINTKPKKLGTKITSEMKPNLTRPDVLSADERPSVLEKEPATGTAPDVEAKPAPDKPDVVANDSNEPTPDVDPYAKFRGYSMPPQIQQCWEDGVDNNKLYGINPETSRTKIKNDDTNIVAPNEATPDVDPYAKFKGYSMPPQIQQCWEDGVDNNTLYGINPETSRTKIKNEDSNLVAPIMDKLSQAAADKPSDSTWGGWGSWGVGSLLSSATEGVSTLTSHVSSVLESGIGAPNPEELARINQLEKRKLEAETSESPVVDSPAEESAGIFSFGHLMTSMSSISKLVESTGSKVLSGGLDTLETIGKKTMEVLQEGDPGLKKKRAIFSDSTVLSQILREAKEQAELEDKEAENKQAIRNIHFETLFDDYQGLVHLEALEMLSKQCDLKLQSLLLSSSGPALSQLQEKLQEVKEVCQLPDDEDINEEENEPSDWWKELAGAEEVLGVPISTEKLSRIWNETQEWLKASTRAAETTEGEDASEGYSAKEIHKKAVSTLAQLTAISVEQFHKGAELLLVKEKRDSSEEAKTLKQITSVLCLQVSMTATNFCERLNGCTEEGPSDSVNSLITNVFLEASNSSSYIQEAFQLLIPVLQVAVAS